MMAVGHDNVGLALAVALADGADQQNANMRRAAIFRTTDREWHAVAFDLLNRPGEAKMVDPPVYSRDNTIDGSTVRATTKQILQSVPLRTIFRP